MQTAFMQKKPAPFRVPVSLLNLNNLKLDIVAPGAEDLVEFRACSGAEVGQHVVACNVYETKDRVEGNVERYELRVLSYVNSLELAEVAQHNGREVVIWLLYSCASSRD